MSCTSSGRCSYSRRRSPMGAISATRWSARAFLHWMQPIPAVRQPSAAQFCVSPSEKMRWRVEHRALRRIARVAEPLPRRVGHHGLELAAHRTFVFGDADDVAVALRHLASVRPREPGRRREPDVGFGEHVPVELVEPAGDLPGELHVGLLVLADRHHGRVVHDDVRRLQDGIPEEPVGVEVLLLQLLDEFLVGRDALQPAERHHHREQQMEFGVLGHLRLDEERAALWIEPHREPVGGDLEGARPEVARVLVVGGQRVPVHDAVEGVELVLHRHPVAVRPHQVPEVGRPGGPHPGEEALAPAAR